MFWTHRRSRYAFTDGHRAHRSDSMSKPHGQRSSSSVGPGVGSARKVCASKMLRLSTLATSILLAMTACGLGSLAMRDDNARVERPSSALDGAIDVMPSLHVDASRGEVREAAANKTMPARQQAKAISPAPSLPVIVVPPLRRLEPQVMQLVPQVMATADRLPLDIVGLAALAPLQEDEKVGFNAYMFLCCGAAVAAMWLIVRRRRGRRRLPVRDLWIALPWDTAKTLKPHWDYDPEPFDSDAFLRRWETIELCIHGDMDLLDAIAGQRMPDVFVCAGWNAPSAPHRSETEAIPWWCKSIQEDHAQALLQWRRLDLRIDGDAHLLAAIAGRMGPHGAMDGQARCVEAVAPEALSSPEAPVRFAEMAEDRAAPQIGAPGIAAGSEMPAAIGSGKPSFADESPVQDQPALPYQDISDADLIARSNAWIGEMSRRGLSDSAGAWLLAQSLMARAGQRAEHEAATLQEAAAKFAGWTANLAPMELRPSWRARWLDIQVARLCTLKGASRLLGFRSLDADCAADVSPEVMDARVRLLLRWSEGLIGTAARTKRAEADALAVRLRQMHDESQLAPAPVHRQSTY